MSYTFEHLWKLLIEKELTREKLRKNNGLSSARMTNLAKNGNPTVEALAHICQKLGAQLSDICQHPGKEGPHNV
ncbi:helix-turn-helix transcriptional regulator [Corynebacterium sp. CCM 9185]|uniref:Helix-turn-helix transcriptional regulator n=1 Tax=Corynebacterium marambiense TaxID=2765364 RepID=A0ABS0VXW8_9CORY|nr:helix-turn-helix transcriptional regulator [Corynebacterium marambiense]MBI9001592.1 helix-turn-helix transcriptional regulator [Corynebacterium marambiense]MCK7662058.1 helix-turn-helix transcriptional regulator [Corynebacterium marambiense]